MVRLLFKDPNDISFSLCVNINFSMFFLDDTLFLNEFGGRFLLETLGCLNAYYFFDDIIAVLSYSYGQLGGAPIFLLVAALLLKFTAVFLCCS